MPDDEKKTSPATRFIMDNAIEPDLAVALYKDLTAVYKQHCPGKMSGLDFVTAVTAMLNAWAYNELNESRRPGAPESVTREHWDRIKTLTFETVPVLWGPGPDGEVEPPHTILPYITLQLAHFVIQWAERAHAHPHGDEDCPHCQQREEQRAARRAARHGAN